MKTKFLICLMCFVTLAMAFGKISSSMLGTKGNSTSDEQQQFENPYIVDGLIAMWDVEWNNGNKHVWKDLTGNENDFHFDSQVGIEWRDNNLLLSKTEVGYPIEIANIILPIDFEKITDKTVTIVMRLATIDTRNDINTPLKMTSICFPCFRRNCVTMQSPIKDKTYSFGLTSEVGQKIVSATTIGSPTARSTVEVDNVAYSLALWGISTSTDVHNRVAIQRQRYVDVELYSIRIYTKKLTEEECAYNYRIDKRRFGL